ncbi:unnamed protein product [Amoebophrya sp. A120]|nr:unnamed protein product [Amoebophrya sp. A120]|eukprot:GSA120T00001250001.1
MIFQNRCLCLRFRSTALSYSTRSCIQRGSFSSVGNRTTSSRCASSLSSPLVAKIARGNVRCSSGSSLLLAPSKRQGPQEAARIGASATCCAAPRATASTHLHESPSKELHHFYPSATFISTMAAGLSWDTLAAQDDVATSCVIDLLCEDGCFKKLSDAEMTDILSRDQKDGDALAAGIKFAQDKGVLPALKPDPYTQINVLGKSADIVAEEILKAIGEGADKGCVLVLVGLSGTGKGTTVAKLQAKLKSAVTWSNGNLFRCLTVQACDFCEKNGVAAIDEALTAENLDGWMKNLKFGKFNEKWDIQLTRADGSQVLVSETCNTLLKEPRIGQNIPSVAKKSQGEVVKFAADACQQMGQDGSVVLVEGREETVNFIPTPHRFCLMMSDTTLIGKRRAAQRVLGEALKGKDASSDVADALKTCVATLA